MEFNKYLPTYCETLQIFLLILKLKLKSFLFGYSDEVRLAPVEKYVEAHCAAEVGYFGQTVQFSMVLVKRYTREFATRPLIRSYLE